MKIVKRIDVGMSDKDGSATKIAAQFPESGIPLLTAVKNRTRFLMIDKILQKNFMTVECADYLWGVEVVTEGLPIVGVNLGQNDPAESDFVKFHLSKNELTEKRVKFHQKFFLDTFGIEILDERIVEIEKSCGLVDEHPGSSQIMLDCFENEDELDKILDKLEDDFGEHASVNPAEDLIQKKMDSFSGGWAELPDDKKRMKAIEKLVYENYFHTGKSGFVVSKPSAEEVCRMAIAENMLPMIRVSTAMQVKLVLDLHESRKDIAKLIGGFIFTQDFLEFADIEDFGKPIIGKTGPTAEELQIILKYILVSKKEEEK